MYIYKNMSSLTPATPNGHALIKMHNRIAELEATLTKNNEVIELLLTRVSQLKPAGPVVPEILSATCFTPGQIVTVAPDEGDDAADNDVGDGV